MKNPKQNRINPKGELVSSPSYGTFMGNRGVLHDEEGNITHRRWRHKNWIICKIHFKGRKRPILAPNRYTELFFLDETTALAAGHRPCAECRYQDYTDYRNALARSGTVPISDGASELDARLHDERAVPRTFRQRTWTADLRHLPDGTMIEHDGKCLLVAGASLLEWSFQGYRIAKEKNSLTARPVTVLTPGTNVRALAAGYAPAVHETAFEPLSGAPVFSKVAGKTY